MSATAQKIIQHYGVPYWSDGLFGVNANGHVSVFPGDDKAALDLFEVANAARANGLGWPVLLRFNDVLRQRVDSLCEAFSEVAEQLSFPGEYRAIYPIKVNQQRSVVDQIVMAGADRVGLEAGSKPELMAVLAAAEPGSLIICNGYKDREYIRLALMGQQLGHPVYVVIEKPSELALVLTESAALGIQPLLGVRVRLASVAGGKWQNSGGAGAKFGLSASQIVALLDQLKSGGQLHSLQLLHAHIGSQIPNHADIERGMTELACYYAELRAAGASIDFLDVGGGLGVDYEGSASQHYCSVNYDLFGYARAVLGPIAQRCEQDGLPAPMILSESGRALTAHHAVLVTEVVERESPLLADPPHCDAAQLQPLMALYQVAASGVPQQVWAQAKQLFEQLQQAFVVDQLGLALRAQAEQLLYAIAAKVRGSLRLSSRRQRELYDELNALLAERVFCNFSLFQSLPDAWAIEQVFPVMPLHRLNETPSRAAVLHDLTCDSDGCIRQYVDQDGVEPTLPIHKDDGQPYLLGIFLVGAYQEILGDMHNLFGDTDAVNVELDGAGGFSFSGAERGDSVDELLRYVHFEPQHMLERYRQKLAAADLQHPRMDSLFRELKAGLHGTTYLTD